MKALQMTKRHIFQSKVLMGLGIFFQFAPFTVHVKGNYVRFLLIRDLPLLGYFFFAYPWRAGSVTFALTSSERKPGSN